MSPLSFSRSDATEAIRLAQLNGIDWLYRNYPKPGGQSRKSTTGFLMHEGVAYPVKPLGRLANKIAGDEMTENPITNIFRSHFEKLGFQLIDTPAGEAELAEIRQRRVAEAWARPGQAKFRQSVFDLFGAKCLVTGCETLLALEVAHIVPVADGGCDEAWNGIPLRADLHRLFDAGAITLEPSTWTFLVDERARGEYGMHHNLIVKEKIQKTGRIQMIKNAFLSRNKQILLKI